jgi:hypothetical protein
MCLDQGPVRVLAISGSLRRASSNSALVGAAARLAYDTVEMSIYRGFAKLPLNPDIDDDAAPEAVPRFRAALQACDEVLISSPEYRPRRHPYADSHDGAGEPALGRAADSWRTAEARDRRLLRPFPSWSDPFLAGSSPPRTRWSPWQSSATTTGVAGFMVRDSSRPTSHHRRSPFHGHRSHARGLLGRSPRRIARYLDFYGTPTAGDEKGAGLIVALPHGAAEAGRDD